VTAIADSIEERLKRTMGTRPAHIEGRRQGHWILMDYIDFVVHVFLEERRGFFRLERLWGDAPRIDPAGLPTPSDTETHSTPPLPSGG